ncbi:histone deacetylase family protein [uncultured Sphaerotilus sp.]|uniref:histone deacetylase family protein n=1 Tax=uncultured Sphaerotilus sp. TaxID=474984 RepID=UPI0030CA30D1
MRIIHNPDHRLHTAQHEMYRGRLVPCHETPDRLDHVLAALQQRPVGPLCTPEEVPDAALAAIHSPAYLAFLAGAWDAWVALDPANAAFDILPSVWPGRGFRHDVVPRNFAAQLGLYAFDAGSPMVAGTWAAVRAGAACAVTAARAVTGGERSAMALTRPPGHHAGPDFFGGYCFLNNAALAAQTLRDGGAARVAVLDVDYHHGNGTQTIFEQRADVLTVSLHGDPMTEYPFFLGHADERGQGAGQGFNLNLPLPRGTSADTWFATLDHALQAVERFRPDALVVPLGVDTFEGDPISGFHLRSSDYLRLGERLARLGLPTVFTMEGGYAVADVGINVVNVLQGFEERTP